MRAPQIKKHIRDFAVGASTAVRIRGNKPAQRVKEHFLSYASPAHQLGYLVFRTFPFGLK